MIPDTVRSVSFTDFITSWNFISGWTVVLAISAGFYYAGFLRLVRKNRAGINFAGPILAGVGFISLSLALIGPFEVFSGETFWAHMTQHMLIIIVAAPAILSARALPVYLWVAPRVIRVGSGILLNRKGVVRYALLFLTNPKFALPFFVLVLWGWHYPPAYELALRNSFVHFAEHLTMFAAAVFFWWPIIGPPPVRSSLSYPQRLIYLILIVTPSAALAALITLIGRVIYPFYLGSPSPFGLSALESQVIGGIIMWIPGNLIYLLAVTVIFFTWAKREMAPQPHRRGGNY